MNIILFGAQGSGKGTQAQMLADELKLQPRASGELLRDAIAHETPAGKIAKPYYDRGDLVPDEIVTEMILESMRGANGIILDGFPRTLRQAYLLDESLAKVGQRIDAAVYLEVPREVLLERLSGRWICRAHGHVWNVKTHPTRIPGICDYDGSPLYHRSDDSPETINRRLEKFFSETIPVVDFYARQGKLIRIDGTDTIEHVNQHILAGLSALGQQSVVSAVAEDRTSGK
ncbi:MAG: adenylate kinase family protein [Ktedonobacterales bacterium]